MNKYILNVLLLIVGACSSPMSPKKNIVTEVHIPSSVNRYFLAEIPDWVNFSETSSCKRNTSLRYLNFSNLHQSFDLSYRQIVFMQLAINQSLQKTRSNTQVGAMSLELEEKVFFKAKDEVLGGIWEFKQPEINKVHVVWIDPALRDPKALARLKKLMKDESFFQGHPVFVSSCLTQKGLHDFLEKNHWADIDVRFVSTEMFSPYNSENNFWPGFIVNINKLMPKKELTLYKIDGRKSPINGKYKKIVRL